MRIPYGGSAAWEEVGGLPYVHEDERVLLEDMTIVDVVSAEFVGEIWGKGKYTTSDMSDSGTDLAAQWGTVGIIP